ncbi:pentapeptide repeat-containing protein [Nocardia concava]|uniref:pentapeptide repeat-containing protein n=1 Tax=Nocardia concava TaxID=257281 RepID=UPI0003034975|nr:pentapeptide repeat-containing protein [Nocardia concava]
MFGFDLRPRRGRAERSHLERFDTATSQLGADDIADRIAGVHALANLADEWDWRGRQDCIDSLCGYLRTYRQDDQAARRTITQAISTRLQPDYAVDWSAHVFDLRGATLEDADFRSAVFGSADFEGVKFRGTVDFARASFYETPSFVLAEFDSNVDFSGATFDWVTFQHARFSGAVDFTGAKFGVVTDFSETRFSGPVDFGGARFSGTVNFQRASITAVADFTDTQFQGSIDLWGSEFANPIDFPPSEAVR